MHLGVKYKIKVNLSKIGTSKGFRENRCWQTDTTQELFCPNIKKITQIDSIPLQNKLFSILLYNTPIKSMASYNEKRPSLAAAEPHTQRQ